MGYVRFTLTVVTFFFGNSQGVHGAPTNYLELGLNAARNDAIEIYFKLGFSYMEIVLFLNLYNGIEISLRHLKRILQSKGLSRRKRHSDIGVVFDAIEKELSNNGADLCYRFMRDKLRQEHDVVTYRETVRRVLASLDPEGVLNRKRRRLHRRTYGTPGPDYLWHIDGWDKLKRYGLCIHGCIDGFSRKIIWLQAATTNNDPFGKSTSNQRIENWWSKFQSLGMGVWIRHFKNLEHFGIIDTSVTLDIECIAFCCLDLLVNELETCFKLWNTHHIRRSRHDTISEKPDVIYHIPEAYDGVHCLQPFNEHQVNVLSNILTCDVPKGNSLFRELFQITMELEGKSMPTSLSEAEELLAFLLDSVHDEQT